MNTSFSKRLDEAWRESRAGLIAVLAFYIVALLLFGLALNLITNLDSTVVNTLLNNDFETCKKTAPNFKNIGDVSKYCSSFATKKLYFYIGLAALVSPAAIFGIKKNLYDSFQSYVDFSSSNGKKGLLLQSANLSALIFALPVHSIVCFYLFLKKSQDLSGLALVILLLSVHMALMLITVGTSYLTTISSKQSS